MSPLSLFGWLRVALLALFLVALLLAAAVVPRARSRPRPPVVEARDLRPGPDREVVVIGGWQTSGPCEQGHMVVSLRGRDGGRVICHFEGTRAIDRDALEARLTRRAMVAVCGRCVGIEDGWPVLRDCRLLD